MSNSTPAPIFAKKDLTMTLQPSIIQKDIIPSIGHNGGPILSDSYTCYMYKFINVENGVWYLGIKKDKLPEHGGDYYWGTSKNDEFNKLVQGNKPLFKLEILQFSNDYEFLQLKEHRMLQEVPNIKTNPATYNLSYGIPPLGKDSLPSEEYLNWFRGAIDSGEWVDWDNPESVKALIAMFTYQVRAKDNRFHVNEIAAELNIVGNNISNMKPILIFEGVGEKFGFPEGSDVVVGKRHGLMAMAKQKVFESLTCRVPYEILKDKSVYFLKALAGFDNKNADELKYDSDFEDGAKLLVELKIENGVEPNSEIAKEQLKNVLGLKGWSIKKAIGKAQSDLKVGKKGKKWKNWTKSELETKARYADNETQIGIYMSSGKFDSKRIMKEFYDDHNTEAGQKRTKMKLFIYHPDADAKDDYDSNISEWLKQLKFWLDDKGFKVDISPLDHEIDDTENNYIAEVMYKESA